MELSRLSKWPRGGIVGYVVNAKLSDEHATRLAGLAAAINDKCNDSLLCLPARALHITLADWIAPLDDYAGRDKDDLFGEIFPSYDHALTNILAKAEPITVHFDALQVSPSAVFIVGHDNGAFQRIRDEFVANVTRLPYLPPAIVHCTLARFAQEIELSKIQKVLADNPVSFDQVVTSFRLVRTTNGIIDNAKILKRYDLR